MTNGLGKSCSVGLPRVPFKLLSIYVFSYFLIGFEGRIWDLIVSVPDHCLSFYFDVVRGTGQLRSLFQDMGQNKGVHIFNALSVNEVTSVSIMQQPQMGNDDSMIILDAELRTCVTAADVPFNACTLACPSSDFFPFIYWIDFWMSRGPW